MKKINLKKIKINKYVILGIIGAAVAGGVAVYALSPEKVDVHIASKQDVEQQVRVTGKIAAGMEETLYAPVTGRLKEVSFGAGDMVTAEEILAQYDLTTITFDYDKAVAIWESNKNGYQSAVTENNKANAQLNAATTGSTNDKTEIAQIQEELGALNKANREDYMSEEDKARSLDLERKIKTAEIDLNQNLAIMESALAKIEGAKQYEVQYHIAQANTQSAQSAYDAAAAAANANPSDPALETARVQAQTVLNNAKAEEETAKTAYFAVKPELDAAQNEYNDASAKVTEYRDRISEKTKELNAITKSYSQNTMSPEEYSRYVALEARLKTLEQDLGEKLTDKQISEGKLVNSYSLEQYQDMIDIAEVDMENAKFILDMASAGIVAEKEGTILEKYVNANAYVEAGQPICKIQFGNSYKVVLMVSKYDIDKIEVGQSALVTLGDVKYDGIVSRIYPMAETDASGKPKVKVEVELQAVKKAPAIGLEANVIIYTRNETDVLAVPYECVYTDDNGDYVYILKNGVADKRYVAVSVKGEDFYSISDGIEEGDKIISSPFSDDAVGRKYSGSPKTR